MEKALTIEIAVDNEEAEDFCAWLIENGHTASIGRSTGNYVNGQWTSTDSDANCIMNKLWDDYCRG